MPRLRTWFSPQLPAYITVDISDEFEFVLRRSVTFSTSSCTSITCWLSLITFHSPNTVSILVSDVVDCSQYTHRHVWQPKRDLVCFCAILLLLTRYQSRFRHFLVPLAEHSQIEAILPKEDLISTRIAKSCQTGSVIGWLVDSTRFG